ncbi:MAG: carbohydrate ABC transporter permease [Candidatus Kapabacteria bacterium]|nr:carbohydrate ABC transporter permease [Candidatus Kapabacteria bacterium]
MKRVGKKVVRSVVNVLLVVVAIGMIAPMAWMVITSLRANPEQYVTVSEMVGAATTFENYADAWRSDNFLGYFVNSLLVATVVTAGNVIFCLWAGYAFARRRFRGRVLLFATVLGVLVVPQQVIMIPLYRLMAELGWINTYWALIVPWLVTPFGIFLVKQYIESMPSEIEDAARIDGAGEWYIMFRVVMPLARPVLTVLAIYMFLSNWNSFLFPFLFTNDEAHRTLPVGLAFYLGKQSIDWGHLMAGASIAALPILALFVVFQKRIIEGLTAGALKE